ncbi:MAG: hypothetical protein FOGNACKC_00477 [Anaerolineae bacterium]|nr:hypothetical protein [Anaerolineae bacterium]
MMTWMLEDKEKKFAEEDRQAKVGGCIALVLLAFIIPAVCWGLATYTSGGQIIKAHALTYYAYNGLPLGNLTPGLIEMAKQSCQLDQTQPANIKEAQQQLTQKYDSQIKLYHENWNKLKSLDQDTSRYQDPGQIPGNLASAKIIYCAR